MIRGVDQFWDVSLAHFIHALTIGSAPGNAAEMAQRGLLQPDRGVPRAAREKIESMMGAVRRGEIDGNELKGEIDRWGLWEEYENQFLDLYRKRS